MFDLRLQVVIYPEREWSDWESRPQQRWLLFCGRNTYRLQSCAFVDNPSHESPRNFNQNFKSEFFNRFAPLPSSELPGMSSSGKTKDRTRTRHKTLLFRGPRCLVFVQLGPDYPGSPPFWNKVYGDDDLLVTKATPILSNTWKIKTVSSLRMMFIVLVKRKILVFHWCLNNKWQYSMNN